MWYPLLVGSPVGILTFDNPLVLGLFSFWCQILLYHISHGIINSPSKLELVPFGISFPFGWNHLHSNPVLTMIHFCVDDNLPSTVCCSWSLFHHLNHWGKLQRIRPRTSILLSGHLRWDWIALENVSNAISVPWI